jgi:hypothetical protein
LTPLPDAPSVVRASDSELRRLFNEAYLVRVLNGQLSVKNFGDQSLYQNPPADWREPEPIGTITGLIEIIDPSTNRRVAIAHRLLRPDGSFGASGFPDPKMVLIGNVIHVQKRKEGRTPQDQRLPSLFTDAG